MATQDADEYEFEKLKLLFDYTKLHIGFYIVIAGIFAGLISASARAPTNFLFPFSRGWLIAAVALIAVAGFAGGVLLSSMCHERSLAEFWTRRIRPFWFGWLPSEYWTYIEQVAFWAAGCALYAFFPK